MPNSLTTFLTSVSIDPRKSISLHRDFNGTVNGSTLSAASKAAVLSKNPATIRDAILKEKGVAPGGVNAAGDTEVVLVIVI